MAEPGSGAVAAPTQRPREPIALTLILLGEVFLFMLALVGIALINANENTQVALQISDAKLAARQAALIRQVQSDLAQLEVVPADGSANAAAATDLSATMGTITDTQNAFINGGATIDLSGKSIRIPKLPTADEQALLGQIDLRLGDLRGRFAPFSSPGALPKRVDLPARAAAATIGTLPDQTQQLAAMVAATGGALPYSGIRFWLFVGSILMVLAMVATLFQRVSFGRRQLEIYANDLAHRTDEAENATRQLAAAKASTDLIMDTVDRGLFLVRPDYRIDGQYSRELEKIFRTPHLESYNFLNILQTLLTERNMEISRDYMALLFDKRRKERTVLRVNPLNEVEVHFTNPAGGFDSKYLNFSFRRILDGDAVSRVFVAVSDITERVRLERELRESEAKKERQFEFLLGVLHVDPKSLDDFLKTADEQIAIMNDALRASDFAATGSRMDLLRQRLDVVYRAVHTIKGNAAMLQLTYFQKICDGFEMKIAGLRERRTLSGDDFLAVVIAQSELRQDVEELQDLRVRFVTGDTSAFVAKDLLSSSAPMADLVSGIQSLANAVSLRDGKQVRIDAAAFSVDGLSDDLRRAVKDVLIQLTRNAVMHGVEGTAERKLLHKPEVATLTLKSQLTPASYAFTFRDDGRGLSPTFIREKAVESKFLSPKAAAAMSDQQIVGLIFRSGFTTETEASTDAGRGVGMNVIKDIIVDKLGGRLTLNSDPDKFTEFGFEIPLVPKPKAVAPVAELAYK